MSVNMCCFPRGRGKVIKKNGQDGIIIGEYTVEAWTKKISKLLSDKKTLDLIKRKLKNDNTQKTWKDIFFLKFDSNWRNLLLKVK